MPHDQKHYSSSKRDQFTYNKRPAASSYKYKDSSSPPPSRHCDKYKDSSSPPTSRHCDKERYKYTVIICNNAKSVCQYCHIKIKDQDIMLMTKGQRSQNEVKDAPMFYGYHCDCFFLSANVCKTTHELYGYNSLSKYHRQYISRKVTTVNSSKSRMTREMPDNLRVGYSLLSRSYNYYCEQCNMIMLDTDIKIVGTLKHSDAFVVYHPRCFAMFFGSQPIKLLGMEKLSTHDQRGMGVLLNVIGHSRSRAVPPQAPDPLESLMINTNGTGRSSFVWPKDTDSSVVRGESSKRIWDTMPRQSENDKKHSSSSTRKVILQNVQKPQIPEYSRKRRTSFKPNTDTSPRTHHNSSHEKCGTPSTTSYASHEKNSASYVSHEKNSATYASHEKNSASYASHEKNSASYASHEKNSASPTAGHTMKKVEVKKSTIRTEITKILFKYNHDYITSKIVRTMLMQTFGCDLTPHKKYIDDTIMELLDIIDNDPINLKSIPGRIFVDEDCIDPPTTNQSEGPASPVMSPMSANIDDISPFTIMSTQADEIALSNVDNTVSTQASKPAWGDKSNSPKETTPTTSEAAAPVATYSSTSEDRPINLCACCLCCFRILTLEEIPSLYNHIQSQHLACKTCLICDITYKDVYELMLHVAEFHRKPHAFKCKNCGSRFEYHSELYKHVDMCFMSDVSSEEDGSPVRSPSKKRHKLNNDSAGMPELVSTLSKTQDTLNKINEFISGGFDS